MKSRQIVALLCALGFVLIGSMIRAAETPGNPAVPATPASPGKSVGETSPATPATPATPSIGKTSSDDSNGSDHGKSGQAESKISEEIKKMNEAVAKARAEFLQKQQALRGTLPTADKAARDQIRAQLRLNRAEFLSQQKDARNEFTSKFSNLKNELKDHQDAIDDAKGEAKEKSGHARKGL